MAKTPPTNLRTSTLRTLDNFRRNFNPSSIFDCFTTKPAHWDHVTRGPVRSSSSPDLSRPGSARATRGPLATYKTRTKLGLLSAVLRCLPYAVPLTSSDTAPVPARLGSARPAKLQTGSGRVQSPDGLLRHPPPRKGQWLQSPSRTLFAGSRSSTSHSAEILAEAPLAPRLRQAP